MRAAAPEREGDVSRNRNEGARRAGGGRRRAAGLITAALMVAGVRVLAAEQQLSAPAGDPLARRADAVFAKYDSAESPGCALGVLKDGRIVYARGYGMASLEHGIPITPQTIFDIGSTSKQITAASIALLVLDGRLSLDDDIRKHLPEIPSYGTRITIRHLLQHTSGLRDYTDLLSLAGHQTEDLTTEQDGLEIQARQKGVNFPPGTEFRYDNTGFFLASVIVKRVSGKPLRVFADERIFAPLGMGRTHYQDDHAAIVPHKAEGYEAREGGGFRVAMSDWEQVGDGSVQTSVEDLARWDENFYSGAVGGRKMLDLLQTKGALNDGTPIPYGLGLFIDRYRGLDRVQHAGGWAGYRAMLMRFPARHASVITLCNCGEAGTRELAERVSDIYLEGEFTEARPGEGATPAAAEPATVVAPKALARYAGLYWNEHQGSVQRIAVKGGSLIVSSGSETDALRPLGGGRFVLPASGKTYAFEGSGAPLAVSDEDDAKPVVFTRLGETGEAGSRPAPADLAAYAGRYASEEVGADWTISVKDGRLVLRIGHGPEEKLEPVAADIFMVEGSAVRFVRDSAKRISGLTVTDRGVVKLPFRRRSSS